MKQILTLFITLLTFAFQINAQVTLPEKVNVSLPRELIGTTYTKQTVDAIRKNPPARFENTGYWKVFSDRENNITYDSPSRSAKQYKTLGFNQEVKIADIKNGWALVYTDITGIKFPKISKNDATSLGWIPMENLLLWQYCPVDERGIYQKALLTANIDEIMQSKNPEESVKSLCTAFYSPKGNHSKVISMQQIYYVMKVSDGRALLASHYKLDAELSSQMLVGWVDKSSYVSWNQRSCLEPSSNKDDISQTLDGQRVNTYDNAKKEHVQSYWKFDKTKPGRMKGDAMRFPILNNDSGDDNLYKCTVFGSRNGRIVTGDDRASTSEAVDKFIATTKKINLIIVIDGTTSMEPYYPEVKRAISRGLENYFNKKYEIRVGCVIYRDAVDGKYAVEYLPLVDPKDPRLAEFIDKGGEGGIGSSPMDKTMEEDMYLGLETALDAKKMGYTPEQSNLILLVGDCGNHPDDKRQENIIKKMNENRIQFMSFQCNYNPASPSYQLFRAQTQTILKKNLDLQFGPINIGGKYVAKYPEIPDGTGRKFKAMEEDLFVGVMRYPRGQGKLASNVLEEMITHDLKDFASIIQHRFDVMIRSLSQSTAPENNVEYAWIRQVLGNDVADQLYEYNSLMAFTGYTPKATPSGTPYWNPVIFISEDELNSMLKRMEPAYMVARKGGDERYPYVQALEAIVKAMDPSAQTGNTDLGKISALIFGLNVQTRSTGDRTYTLNDLMDPKVVSPQEYRNILSNFKNRYERLLNIQKRYEYTRTFQNIKYYWIPVSDLP